jgi:hypothetical protein
MCTCGRAQSCRECLISSVYIATPRACTEYAKLTHTACHLEFFVCDKPQVLPLDRLNASGISHTSTTLAPQNGHQMVGSNTPPTKHSPLPSLLPTRLRFLIHLELTSRYICHSYDYIYCPLLTNFINRSSYLHPLHAQQWQPNPPAPSATSP